jgi:DNA-binding response OmpR family regulator
MKNSKNAYTILVAEDDADIRQLLKLYLENEGWRVIEAEDGEQALAAVRQEKIDLAVLDIMMPKVSGYEVTRQLRKVNNLPIIILSAKSQNADKILGLDLGADDYITKPFNPLEAVARVKSQLRRYYHLGSGREPAGQVIREGGLEMDLRRMTLTKNGEAIVLTPTEFRLLSTMMSSPGTVFTKKQLYKTLADSYFATDDNTIMVHISNLREKIEDDPRNPVYIKTVRGLGYKFEHEEKK